MVFPQEREDPAVARVEEGECPAAESLVAVAYRDQAFKPFSSGTPKRFGRIRSPQGEVRRLGPTTPPTTCAPSLSSRRILKGWHRNR